MARASTAPSLLLGGGESGGLAVGALAVDAGRAARADGLAVRWTALRRRNRSAASAARPRAASAAPTVRSSAASAAAAATRAAATAAARRPSAAESFGSFGGAPPSSFSSAGGARFSSFSSSSSNPSSSDGASPLPFGGGDRRPGSFGAGRASSFGGPRGGSSGSLLRGSGKHLHDDEEVEEEAGAPGAEEERPLRTSGDAKRARNLADEPARAADETRSSRRCCRPSPSTTRTKTARPRCRRPPRPSPRPTWGSTRSGAASVDDLRRIIDTNRTLPPAIREAIHYRLGQLRRLAGSRVSAAKLLNERRDLFDGLGGGTARRPTTRGRKMKSKDRARPGVLLDDRSEASSDDDSDVPSRRERERNPQPRSFAPLTMQHIPSVERGFEHPVGPRVDGDRAIAGIAIETADIAAGIVEAHQPMHALDRRICGVDRPFRRRVRCARTVDFNESAEKRPCAPHAVSVHTPPRSA